MRLPLWLVLVSALTLALSALAQAPAPSRLQMGNVALTVGMAEKPALAALRREYRVERARGAGENWAVMLRNGETIGVLSFSDGKLTHAALTWYSTGDYDAAQLVNHLSSLVIKFEAEGRKRCTLDTKPYVAAGVRGQIVTLACGSKSIQINTSRPPGGHPSTSLREVLQ